MTRLATPSDTAHGTILGTVHYMPPELVEGKEADARSDIWALGIVIHEMATGKRPFEGESPASIIGSILKDDPPSISSRQRLAPPALDRVVTHALEKDPDERWQSAADLKHELVWIAANRSDSESVTTTPSLASKRAVRWWALTAALLAVVLAMVAPAACRAGRAGRAGAVLALQCWS